MQKNFDKCARKLKKYFSAAKKLYAHEPTGHNFAHIKRCLDFEKKIIKSETFDCELDLETLIIATLFHDTHRVMSSEKHGKFVSVESSLARIRECLAPFNLPQEKLKKILYLILNHENKQAGTGPELSILQDADTLDALGRVGLARTKKYCKTRRIPIFNPKFSLDCPEYVPTIFPISTTHYVYRTMIPQQKLLKTETAKKIGQKRVAVLEKFVKRNVKKFGGVAKHKKK